MSVRGSVSANVLGTVHAGVGVVLTAGGFLEALGNVRNGSTVNVALGVLGGFAGLLFMASAFALWTRRPYARRVTWGAAALALIVHGAGVVLAHPGVLAILIGAVYPAAVLLLLWRKPGLGSGQPVSAAPQPSGEPSRRDGASLRAAMA